MRPTSKPRVLAASALDVSDWEQPQVGGWSQFITALARRYELVGLASPEVSRVSNGLNLARNFRPNKTRWKAAAGFNSAIAKARTAAIQRELDARRGDFDLVFQLQTVFAPGFHRDGVPYAIYTDNTMALTQRFYPAWAPLSTRAARAWMEFEAGVCRSAVAVYTFSEFARRSVIDDYGASEERVLAAGAGANLVSDSIAERNSAKALFVGIDFARKGGHVLLESWPAVRARIPEAELIVAGPPTPPAGGLPDGVRWLGRQDRRSVAELYREASVFVLPSLFEPYGLVFLEAMGSGLPCVGTTRCAMPEIIEDGVTGRLVTPGEAEPLADALVELLGDPASASAMGREAHARVRHGRGWDNVVQRIAEHLSERALSV